MHPESPTAVGGLSPSALPPPGPMLARPSGPALRGGGWGCSGPLSLVPLSLRGSEASPQDGPPGRVVGQWVPRPSGAGAGGPRPTRASAGRRGARSPGGAPCPSLREPGRPEGLAAEASDQRGPGSAGLRAGEGSEAGAGPASASPGGSGPLCYLLGSLFLRRERAGMEAVGKPGQAAGPGCAAHPPPPPPPGRLGSGGLASCLWMRFRHVQRSRALGGSPSPLVLLIHQGPTWAQDPPPPSPPPA